MLSDTDSDLLRSVQSDDFLPSLGLWTRLGGMFLIGAVGVVFGLASVIKYNVTVKAPATVRPTGELRIVQAATQGTVKGISVKENQVVKQGDVLALLDDSRIQNQRSQLQGSIQQNQRQFTQIAAQLEALNNQRLAEMSLINRTIASAQADLSLKQREHTNQQTITQTEAQEAEAALDLAKEELYRYQQLGDTGAIAQLQIKEKENAFKIAQARLNRSTASLNPSAALVTIANEQIAQERARGLANIATLDKEREDLIRRQVEIQNQLDRDQKELQQTEIEISRTIILAPISGAILKLNLRNPSQVVSPGEVIAQIAPNDASMVVKARVASQDISNVQLCQEAQVSECKEGKVQLRFSAYPYPDYGTLKGAVRAISPDAVSPQISGVSSNLSTSVINSSNGTGNLNTYYEVTIELDKPYFVKTGHQYPIQPGMEATADIISREDTILKFILRKARLLTDL